MHKLIITAAAALTVLAAGSGSGEWVYGGKWGGVYGSGRGCFKYPQGITVGASTNVYVADTGNDRVQCFMGNGSLIWCGDSGEYDSPDGLDTPPAGGSYVADTGNCRISNSIAWGSYGWRNGEFVFPHDVAAGPNRNIYVADTGNNRVQYFTPMGSFLGKWGTGGTGNGQFRRNEGIAVSPRTGNVYVADTGNHRIQYFTPAGSFLGKWGSRGSGNGQFRTPEGIAVSIDGTVFVADTANHRIQYFTSDGVYSGHIYPVSNSDVAIRHTGTMLYVVCDFENCVYYYRRVEPAVSPTSLGRVKALFW